MAIPFVMCRLRKSIDLRKGQKLNCKISKTNRKVCSFDLLKKIRTLFCYGENKMRLEFVITTIINLKITIVR